MSRASVGTVAVLVLAVAASGIAVVYSKYVSRKLFVELQGLRAEHDVIDTEWSRLQLELGAWASHVRIEQVARERLGMRMPRADEIVVVRP
ncbi:MAG: cell division protein FtsL [Gammaproteobacteria bacterium]|nr:cell division protein FtsL [Gammaproteobacteria bacterium]